MVIIGIETKTTMTEEKGKAIIMTEKERSIVKVTLIMRRSISIVDIGVGLVHLLVGEELVVPGMKQE